MLFKSRYLYGYDVYAIDTTIQLMEADASKLIHRNAFNVTAMSVDPKMIFKEIKKHIPDFNMVYEIDLDKQFIADSWTRSLDTSCAKKEWGFSPKYDLETMTMDMIYNLKKKL